MYQNLNPEVVSKHCFLLMLYVCNMGKGVVLITYSRPVRRLTLGLCILRHPVHRREEEENKHT